MDKLKWFLSQSFRQESASPFIKFSLYPFFCKIIQFLPALLLLTGIVPFHHAAIAQEIYYYLPDHLGSTTALIDQAGNRLEEVTYLPYGKIRQNTGSVDVHHKYTGQEFDGEIGLYYYGARYYDPTMMHFISADTIEPNRTNPQTLNRYSYTLNNPIKYIDPDGRNPILFLIPIIGGILYDAFSTPDVAIAPTSPSDLSFQSPSTLEHLGSIGAGASIGLAAREGAVALGKEVFEQATGIPTDVGNLAKGADDVINAIKLKRQLTAQEIAGGHAFEKHVLQRGEFPGIRTRDQFAEHIENVINNPTYSGQLSSGRSYFYHQGSNTIVIRNPNTVDGGTAFKIDTNRYPSPLDYIQDVLN